MKRAKAAASSSARATIAFARRWPSLRANSTVAAYGSYLGRPTDSSATMATRPAARAPATAEVAPPPGTGADEPSSSRNELMVSLPKLTSVLRLRSSVQGHAP